MLLFGYLPNSDPVWQNPPVNEVNRSPVQNTTKADANNSKSFELPPTPDHSRINDAASDLYNEFGALRTLAKDSLVFANSNYQRNYNKGRLAREFEVGDLVLLNSHSLHLNRSHAGVGRKLLKKFDGPFEIQDKLSPVTYRLRLPSSYQVHPVINIAHLESYHSSPTHLGPRSSIPFDRAKSAEQEWEVEAIVGEQRRKRGLKRLPYYRVRYVGFGPEHDEWIPKGYLRNAPEILREWQLKTAGKKLPTH